MTTVRRGAHVRFLAVFGALSLAALAVGCVVAAASGVPPGAWSRNPASWLFGALAAVGLALFAARGASLVFLGFAPLGLAASFWAADLQGVHRWVDLGPLHINVAQVLLPPAIVALADQTLGRVRPWLAAAVLLLLVVQPDASQATAFGAALAALIVASRQPRGIRLAGLAIVGLAVLASWLQPDPLAPVPEVEQIMDLAWAVSPLAGVAAWTALLAACGALAAVRTPGLRTAGRALGLYAVLSAVLPIVGAFPVPIVGMAMSPILGLWLGAGMLAGAMRRQDLIASACTPAASGA